MNLSSSTKVLLTITDIAFGGEGVARLNDFVVFVPFVLVGEVVEAEITEIKKKFARARMLRVIQPSPERAEPRAGCAPAPHPANFLSDLQAGREFTSPIACAGR